MVVLFVRGSNRKGVVKMATKRVKRTHRKRTVRRIADDGVTILSERSEESGENLIPGHKVGSVKVGERRPGGGKIKYRKTRRKRVRRPVAD